jgi:UDP-glucose 4-epimerase
MRGSTVRILITGGAGFIGSHLVDAFLDRGDEIAVVDDLSRGSQARLVGSPRFYRLDITDDVSALRFAVNEFEPALICHLAAQIDVRASVTDPVSDANINILGTLNVLEAARQVNARVVFASSGGALYGDGAAIPSTENMILLPTSPYGSAKLSAEHYIGLYNRLYGTRHAILRLANVYGPRQDPYSEGGVVAVFCNTVLTGDAVKIYGDGSQTRDFIHVSDVAKAFMAVSNYDRVGTWNIGTGIETSVLDIVRMIEDLTGEPVVPRYLPARPGEMHRSAIDAQRARNDLDWLPAVSFKAGLASVYEWLARQANPHLALHPTP